MTSYAISYTVSDELSLTYGSETSEKGSTGNKMRNHGITVAYTAGGMAITAKMIDSENLTVLLQTKMLVLEIGCIICILI